MTTCLHKTFKTPNRILYKICVLLFVLFALNANIFAQNVTVKGIVTDAITNEPLIGVNVIVLGEKTGTISDINGHYQIKASSQKTRLRFTYIGYTPQEEQIAGKTEINIKLAPDSKTMDEVVVVGYGSMRKGDISSAITSVSGDAIKDMPVSSVAEAISGKMAGVQVTTTDGDPDAEIMIRVRGGSSITQSNDPLYIVDGFQVTSIKDIAPTDIESISVLKDAASTAIYGSKGANGVILITTKSTKAGKTKVSFNTFLQRKFFPMERKFNVLNPYEYVLSRYEYFKLRGINGIDYNKYFGDFADIDIYKNVQGTDWQDEMFGNVEQYSNYFNVSISGGNETTQTVLSFTQNKDDGLLPRSNYNRSNINFKLNHQIAKNLKLETGLRFFSTEINGAGTSGSSDLRVSDIVKARPTNGLADYFDMSNFPTNTTDDQAYQAFLDGQVNPTEKVKQDYRKKTGRTINMNAALTWNIIQDLTFRSEYGVDYTTGLSERYWGPLTSKSRNDGVINEGERTDNEQTRFRVANTLNYNLKLANNRLNIMVGQEFTNRSTFNQDLRCGFPTEVDPVKMFAQFAKGTIIDRTSLYEPDLNMLSFFTRANYILMDKHVFNLTLRADGTSAYQLGNQWGYFPAASYAYILSEEKFMKDLTFITNLKLRASYGQAGNSTDNPNLSKEVYAISNSRPYSSTTGYYKNGSIMPNPDLKWELSETSDIGTDFSLFRDRLTGTIDVYYNKANGLLMQSPVPASTGYSTEMVNFGETSNKGLEISLEGVLIKQKDFRLSANFNISFNKFNVDKLDGALEKSYSSNWVSSSDLKDGDDYRVIVGQQLGLMYGYVSDGFYSVDDFESYDPATGKYLLKVNPETGKTYAPTNDLSNGIGLRPGVMKLKDLDGDGQITTADRQVIGHASPKYQGGFGLNATYKGFDLMAFFNYKIGFDVYDTSKMLYTSLYRNNPYTNLLSTYDYTNRFKYIDENTGELVTDLEQLRELNKNATTWSPFSTSTSIIVFESGANLMFISVFPAICSS